MLVCWARWHWRGGLQQTIDSHMLQLLQHERRAMTALSIRELNQNMSKAIARAEAGEVIDITRNGKVVAEMRPKRTSKLDDPEYRAKYAAMMALMREGLPGLKGPASYEERTGR